MQFGTLFRSTAGEDTEVIQPQHGQKVQNGNTSTSILFFIALTFIFSLLPMATFKHIFHIEPGYRIGGEHCPRTMLY